jgi:hypothetical protein
MSVDELLDGWQAAWSQREGDAFAEVCAPDVHYEDPLCDEPLSMFPDVRVQAVGERLDDGRFVAAPVKLVGTHRGSREDLPASGRFVVVHAVCYCELDPPRERLWRVRTFFDLWGAAQQTGVLPKRGGIGERAFFMIRGFGIKGR